MMFNEENTVEQMLISVAQKCGWTYVEAKDIPRATDSVLVESWLQDALIRLNKITAAQASQVIYKLRAAIMSGSAPDELIQANDRFRKLLFEENSEPFGKNGDNLNIRFFSENPSENYCVVTNQWEFPRQSIDGGKRLDLVFIINGIPMVIGEAKTPVRPQVTWADGANDLMAYQKSIPEMFVSNVLVFSSEGKELQYGDWYDIQVHQNGNWYSLPLIIDNAAYHDIAYLVQNQTTSVWEINWSYFYGELPAGKYRIVKDIIDLREPGDYTKYYLAVEFEIK